MDNLSIITAEISNNIYYLILYLLIGLGFIIALMSIVTAYICTRIYQKRTPLSIWIIFLTGLVTLAINIGTEIILSNTTIPVSTATIISLIITVIIDIIGGACAKEAL